jgi:hypothetical protein
LETRQLSTLPGWSLVRPQLGPFIVRSLVPTAHSFLVCSWLVLFSDGREFSLLGLQEQGTLCLDQHKIQQNIHIVLDSAANPSSFRIASQKSSFVRFKHLFSSDSVLVSPPSPHLRSSALEQERNMAYVREKKEDF